MGNCIRVPLKLTFLGPMTTCDSGEIADPGSYAGLDGNWANSAIRHRVLL